MSKTLDTLRSNLKVRLGFTASGAASLRNQSIIDSFIEQAYEQVYWKYNDPNLTKEKYLNLGLGQEFVDLGDDVDINRGISVRLRIPGEYDDRLLVRGFPEYLREDDSLPSHPHVITPTHQATTYPDFYTHFYDIETQSDQTKAKVRLLPVPETDTWKLRVNYHQAMPRFTQGSDVLTVDYLAVFLLSLANAKAHYKQLDAESIGRQYDERIKKLKSSEHNGMRYINNCTDELPAPRPRSV